MRLVDTHCHLAHLEGDPMEAVTEAEAEGVEVVVDIGMGTEESEASVRRAEASGGRVWASVGIHPNDVAEHADDPDATITRLRSLSASASCVGIGETGLDLYRTRETPERQEASLRDHIELAREVDKTLVIHCRDAHDRLLDVLDDAGAPERVVMHCFSGDADFARECAERRFFCSFAGNVTFPKAESLREAARVVPEDLVLVETDAPFLAPQPRRGKPNRPAYVRFTAETVAEVRGIAPASMGERLRANAVRAFRLPIG